MRSNKRALLWTLFLAIGLLVACIVLNATENKETIWYDLAMTCFGSALLGVVVAYAAYSAERRNVMEEFWQEALCCIERIRGIKHIRLNTPDELIYQVLNEEKIVTKEAFSELKEWYKMNVYSCSLMHEEQLTEYCKSEIKKDRETIYQAIEHFKKISAMELRPLNNAYGKMDFVIGNKNIKEEAYHSLYEPIYNFRMACKNEDYHFELLLNGAGHYGVVIDCLRKLDEWIFDDNGQSAYASFTDNLLHSLETFRSKIYGIKPEYEESPPIETYFSFPKNMNTSNTEKKQIQAKWN